MDFIHPNKSTNNSKCYDIWFWALLTIGLILRCLHLFQLPFTHDEYSVIFRLDAHSFSELIEKGVVTDTHPPLVQVFIFYWTQLFGLTPFTMKLPFVLMGTGALVVFYRLVFLWTNKFAARIGIAWMAIAQYMIYYSELARPYSFGLLLILLLALQLTHVYQKQYVYKRRYFFILILIMASAYTHYFSMMQAGLLWLVTFWATYQTKRKRYSLLGIAVLSVLLFLPYISVFLQQLNKKGVEEWLGKPTIAFVFNYTSYLFHFSWIFFGLFVAFVATAIKGLNRRFKLVLVSSVLFLVPFLIGYFYSILVAALLQFSVLIFAFPFLLLAFFLLFDWQWNRLSTLLGISFIASGFYTLTVERQHYSLMKVSAFKEITQKATSYHAEGMPAYISITEKIGSLELENLDTKPDSLLQFVDETNFGAIVHQLAEQRSKKLFLGWAHKPFDWRLLTFAKQWGYTVDKEYDYFNGNSFELKLSNTKNLYFNATTVQDEFYEIDKVFQDSIALKGKVLVAFSAVFEADSGNCHPILVCDVMLRNGKTDWHGSSTEIFPVINGITKANLSFVMDIEQAQTFKFYLWNADKCSYKLLDTNIEFLPINPAMYGFFEKIVSHH